MAVKRDKVRAEKTVETQQSRGQKTQLLIEQAIAELKEEIGAEAITRIAIFHRVNQLAVEKGEKGVSLPTIGRSDHVKNLFNVSLSELARTIATDYVLVNLNDLRANRDLVRVVRRLLDLPPEILVCRIVALEEALINSREKTDETVMDNLRLMRELLASQDPKPPRKPRKAKR